MKTEPTIYINQYAKCEGCVALKISRKAGSKNKFVCKLKYPIDQKFVSKGALWISPKPKKPCYRPKTVEEFRLAKSKKRNVE